MTKHIQKSIRFPAKAVEVVEREVRQTLGIDFNKYIQVYVIAKADEIQKNLGITPQLQAEIDASKRRIAEGKDKYLETAADIDEYLSSLENETV